MIRHGLYNANMAKQEEKEKRTKKTEKEKMLRASITEHKKAKFIKCL